MSLDSFEKLNKELQNLTSELAYHIVGDVLTLSNLEEYLNISKKYSLKVNITSTGNNLKDKHYKVLTNSIVKQINFSLNSYSANSHKKSLEEYLEPIFLFIKYILENKIDIFINFRVWNLDNNQNTYNFNESLFSFANSFFGTNFRLDDIYVKKIKRLKVARKVFFTFDEYFEWPSLNSVHFKEDGFCYGLNSHFGILSNGVVVPCCLDKDAIINLGDANKDLLVDTLNSKRAKEIQNGFLNKIAIEELCKKCEYKNKFNHKLKSLNE